MTGKVRLAVRAMLLQHNRLLLVNAYAGGVSDLWCAPGGGVEVGESVEAALCREVHEETGLTIEAGELAALSQFHDPQTGFQQVELIFRARIVGGQSDTGWQDPDAVVTERRFFAREELGAIRVKPDFLRDLPWEPGPFVLGELERKAP